MNRIVAALTAAVAARPGLAALAAVLLMVGGAALGTRVQLEDDARALIASGDPKVARALEALSQFTAVDQLLIQVDGTDDPERLEQAARVLAASLETSGRFSRVRYAVDAEQQVELADALMPRRFILDPRPAAELITEERLRSQLHAVREMLLAPKGIIAKSLLLRDPLGSLSTVLADMSNTPGLTKLDTQSGQFLSADRNSLLVLATPKGNPFGATAAAATMEAVETGRQAVRAVAPKVVLRPIGAHRFTHDAGSIIKRDVYLSAGMTLAVVLVIFVGFFRRPTMALVAVPPLAFGICTAVGLTGLLGKPVHGIVLAFAAACLGLSIDYTIHLLAATAASGSYTREAVVAAARRIGGSLGLAMLSTMAGLGTLALSRVDALRQMAVLAIGAVGGAFIGNLLWLPIILPLVARRAPKPKVLKGPWVTLLNWATGAPRTVLILAVAACCMFAAGATRMELDGDLRNLDTRSEAGRADLKAFVGAFGDPGTAILALVETRTLEEALESAEQTRQLLLKAGVNSLLSPTVLAPPPSVSQRRRQQWCADGLDPVAALQSAGASLGFKPEAFESFAADWRLLCSPAGQELLKPEPAISAFEQVLGRPVVRDGPEGRVRLALAFEAPDRVRQRVVQEMADIPSVTVIDRVGLNARLVEIIAAELPRLSAIALAVVVCLLFLVYRRLVDPLRALAPCVLGMLATLGLLSAFGLPVNLMNLCVFPLLAGLGIDYGVLMADAQRDPTPTASYDRAFSVTVAAATTMAGFGSLAVARYQAIATIGRSVLLAVLLSAFFALLLPPALASLSTRRKP